VEILKNEAVALGAIFYLYSILLCMMVAYMYLQVACGPISCTQKISVASTLEDDIV
jgi:hypothetical protein